MKIQIRSFRHQDLESVNKFLQSYMQYKLAQDEIQMGIGLIVNGRVLQKTGPAHDETLSMMAEQLASIIYYDAINELQDKINKKFKEIVLSAIYGATVHKDCFLSCKRSAGAPENEIQTADFAASEAIMSIKASLLGEA